MGSVADIVTFPGIAAAIATSPGVLAFGLVAVVAVASLARSVSEHLRRIAAREWDTRNTDVTPADADGITA
jgi:hypothetical protein